LAPLCEVERYDERIELARTIVHASSKRTDTRNSFYIGGIAASEHEDALAVLYLSHREGEGGAGIPPMAFLYEVPQFGSSQALAGEVEVVRGTGGAAFLFPHRHAQRAEATLFLSREAFSYAMENFEREMYSLKQLQSNSANAQLYAHQTQSSITALLIQEACKQNRTRVQEAMVESAFTGEPLRPEYDFTYFSVNDLQKPDANGVVQIEITGFLVQPAGKNGRIMSSGTMVRQRHCIRLAYGDDCRVQAISERGFQEAAHAAA
jgi:hypothetical protein